MGFAAAAVAASSVVGAVVSSSAQSDAASKAASAQNDASRLAANTQLDMYNTTRGDLLPYNTLGQGALGALGNLTGTGPGGNPLDSYLTKPFQPTMDQLSQTPGYQFALDQGTKAAQNSYAGAGLGRSGAGMKGAINYAEGLAGTTYQTQFANDLMTKQQIYNMLYNQSQQGENAAAQTGQQGTLAAQNAGTAYQAAGNANAAADYARANGLTNAVNGVTGAGQNMLGAYAYYGNQNGWFNSGGVGGAGAGIASLGDTSTLPAYLSSVP